MPFDDLTMKVFPSLYENKIIVQLDKQDFPQDSIQWSITSLVNSGSQTPQFQTLPLN